EGDKVRSWLLLIFCTRRAQESGNSGQLFLPADERCGWDGQVVEARVQGLEEWELGRQVRDEYLEYAFGSFQVFEAVFAEVEQFHPGGQEVLHQLLGRAREKGVPPMARGKQPGHAVDGLSKIVPALLLDKAGM